MRIRFWAFGKVGSWRYAWIRCTAPKRSSYFRTCPLPSMLPNTWAKCWWIGQLWPWWTVRFGTCTGDQPNFSHDFYSLLRSRFCLFGSWLLKSFRLNVFSLLAVSSKKSPAPQHCLVTMQKIMQSHFSWFIGDSSHWHCFCFILLTFTYSTADHVMRFYEYCYSYTGNYLDHWRMTARWSCYTFIPRILSTSTGKNQNQTPSHPL